MTSSDTGAADAQDKSVTAFLPQHKVDTFLCVSSERVCSATTEADGKPPSSWGSENWAKKVKHHREMLSRTIKTEEISVLPPSRDSFAKISIHIIN